MLIFTIKAKSVVNACCHTYTLLHKWANGTTLSLHEDVNPCGHVAMNNLPPPLITRVAQQTY
jgi:hypothetical protein